jgi:hypothetical protein
MFRVAVIVGKGLETGIKEGRNRCPVHLLASQAVPHKICVCPSQRKFKTTVENKLHNIFET